MIIAERKPFKEVLEMIEPYDKVFVAACGTCVTVCYAGGEKEAELLATELRIARKVAGKKLETLVDVVERQCEWEYLDEFKDKVEESQAVISMACGIGIQAMAEKYPGKPIFPGVNTKFIGIPQEQGVWKEMCALCGNCVTHMFGGICPIGRCSKGLLNGPCGGSQGGKCEIDPELDCGWQLIYDHLKALGQLDRLEKLQPPKDWSVGRFGRVGKLSREDMKL